MWHETLPQVMTSFHPKDVKDHLLLIASTTLEQEEGGPQALKLRIPRSDAYFTGVGVHPELDVLLIG